MFNVNLIHVPVQVLSDVQLSILSGSATALSKMTFSSLKLWGPFVAQSFTRAGKNTYAVVEYLRGELSRAISSNKVPVPYATLLPLPFSPAGIVQEPVQRWQQEVEKLSKNVLPEETEDQRSRPWLEVLEDVLVLSIDQNQHHLNELTTFFQDTLHNLGGREQRVG